jgi:hypothetical protein
LFRFIGPTFAFPGPRARLLAVMSPIPRRASSLLLLLAGACSQKDATAPVTQASAWLAISNTDHDLGDIAHGRKEECIFTVKNTAAQTVRLAGMRQTCTCATQELSITRAGQPIEREIHMQPVLRDGGFLVTTLEPGEQLTLKVTVDTSLRAGLDHHEDGKLELAFEPEEAGHIVFGYHFTIRARMRLLTHDQEPRSPTVELGEFSKSQEVLGVLELAPLEGAKSFRILDIVGTDDLLKLEKKNPLLPGGYRWLVRYGPRGEPGPVSRVLSFKTDLEDDYVMNILVDGIALSNLSFVPAARLDLNRFDWSQPKQTYVTVIYRKPIPNPGFAIGRIKVEKPGGVDVSRYFEADVTEAGASRWQITLQYLGGLDGKRFDGFVQLKTADPEHKSTLVRFTGFNTKK